MVRGILSPEQSPPPGGATGGTAAVPRAEALWTLPNVVSLSRVVLAGAFVASTGPGERLGLVGAAAVSDMLDGWLARRARVASRWGALIDPIADRLFALAALVTLLVDGQLALGHLAVLLLRDVMTTIGFFVARVVRWLRPARFVARPLGKVVTVLQLAALVSAIAWPAVLPALVAVVGVASVAATADYTLALWRARDRTVKP